MRRVCAPLLLGITLAGCGYFNSLYNANRLFADAERAAARGDAGAARAGYAGAIERAAVSYRGHPDGRWSDDALLLVGRAHFALGHDVQAAGAMRYLMARTVPATTRATAAAYLGAALLRLDSLDAALAQLDSAATFLSHDSEHGAFARLWRGRAARAARRGDGWSDLELAAAQRTTAVDASFEMMAAAVASRDSARLGAGARHLASLRIPGPLVPRVESLLRAAASDWSPAAVLHASAPLEHASWRAEALNLVGMARAEIAVAAGDVPYAVRIVDAIADGTAGGTGSRARVLAARWRLGDARSPEDLADVQRLLLAALDDAGALELLRNVRAVQLLAAGGTSPASSLSLFAAAELAGDLGAELLARNLFLEFVAIVPESPWAGKAALAAHRLHADPETDRLLARLHANPYVRAAGGAPHDDELVSAEQRLARGITGLRADALAEVVLRDAGVGRALAVLDSSRAAARSDSVRIGCGALVDSLQVGAGRADSVRTACIRGDTARVTFLLREDSAALRDSARARRPLPVRPDTSAYESR